MKGVEIEKAELEFNLKFLAVFLLLTVIVSGWLFWSYGKKRKVLAEMKKQREKYLAEYKTLKEAYNQVYNKLEKISYFISEAKKNDEATEEDYPIETLTKRELEVLSYISIGLLDKEIADKLDISVTTVRTHCRNIYKKLGINNRTEAAKIAGKYKV